MNLGELKAFLGQKAQYAQSNNARQPQGQAVGHTKQAQPDAVTLSNLSQSQRLMSVRVLTGSFNQNLEINGQKPNLTEPSAKEQDKPLFDFNEVVKNVLGFISGALNKAKQNNASDDQLTTMLQQARDGVAKGIEMAEEELGELMNDDIQEGISESRERINQGIDDLETKLFSENTPLSSQSVTAAQSLSYSQESTGSLTIRTQDGDEVSLSFEDIRRFEASQAASISQTADGGQGFAAEQLVSFYERSGIAFSVKGELDQEEMDAIAKLVGDTADLADEFFNGDVEKAYNEALKLGFDEKELTGFALNLSRQEQTRVVQAYESVSSLKDESGQGSLREIKPVAHYLDKMLDVMDQAQKKLEDVESFDNLIQELLNQMMDDLKLADLVDAVNQFQQFNARLLDNLPQAVKDESTDTSSPSTKME
ncbi:hypothetical protein HMF8227_02020 [Saliniradius amylolyticus]|uniref:DUF5610 domain-containing protein n=1 Tax=Saliniradius amylolyticus TaxID=2183582 RepID=A0A2S2E4A4_9ALTE|nr:DUF5610 domain-containing protein [Saliniradius amylolyticus]AWL12485.1 hypothetical protein HMF8227_02020 [Saliniradius amylolyticus]